MIEENELKALIALLDDNDPEVFGHVSNRLFSMGPAVIDRLEDAYVSEPNPLLQERIEGLIHKIQFDRVEKDFAAWIERDSDDLLRGLMILSRQQYPDLDEEKVKATVARMQKDIWIGLNNYLSPLEQMNVVNQTLFSQYQITGMQSGDNEMHFCYLNNVTETLKGNHFSIGLLYLVLCQKLDLPVYGVRLSSHFILARTKDFISDFSDADMLKNEVLFYINPYNKGLAFSDREINVYLKKLDLEIQEAYYLPASNTSIMLEYIRYLMQLFNRPEDSLKVEELGRLESMLSV